MKLFNVEQIRQGDLFTIENEPVSSIDLMERAAGKAACWISRYYPTYSKFVIFAGTGNNGGDGVVIARLLAAQDFNVKLFIVRLSENETEDFKTNLNRLISINLVDITELTETDELPMIEKDSVIIDALFGSGLTRPLQGFAAQVVKHLYSSGADIISIDMPSGLFGEDNSANERDNIIRAKYTLTFQFPKLSFFFPENEKYTGKWIVLPIGIHQEFIDNTNTNYHFITEEDILPLLKTRRKFAHKKNFGHALLVSGSYGKMGAAVLASKGCLRTGAGLLTVHVPSFGYGIIQTSVPEAMTSIDIYNKVITNIPLNENFNAIGIGPGIGKSQKTQEAIKELFLNTHVPLVIDADALNILADNKDWINKISSDCIFTPHPKEFERLAGLSKDGYSRLHIQIDFAIKYNLYIVLKGAYTSIACPDGTCYLNSTGNPGMATGGSGDVLTGMILSLLAQGYPMKDAALTGVFIHGLAGDIAADELGEEALIAGDIVNYIGKAFRYLRKRKGEPEAAEKITGIASDTDI
jgi:NAD(P)H-hydrate epimerase